MTVRPHCRMKRRGWFRRCRMARARAGRGWPAACGAQRRFPTVAGSSDGELVAYGALTTAQRAALTAWVTAQRAATAVAWRRAFASGMVTPATPGMTPAVLACIGRELILRGEIVFDIRMGGAGLALVPAANWDVEGHGPDPASWRCRVYLNGPSGTTVAMRPAAGVVHAVYSVDPARPWESVSPVRRARLSAALASSLETRLGEKAGASTGRVLPFPDTGADAGDGAGPLATLRADLAALKGKTALVPSMATGWGEGRGGPWRRRAGPSTGLSGAAGAGPGPCGRAALNSPSLARLCGAWKVAKRRNLA